MKFSTVFIFSAIVTLLFCSSVQADDPVTITVTGNIVASPCQIDPDSVSKAISLGDNLQASDLSAPGSASDWVNVIIKLINCPAGTTSVTTTFHGSADPADPTRLYLNTGTAKNVSVQLTGLGDEAFGNGQTYFEQISGSAQFSLRTRAYSTAGGATPGSISSVITMTFTYN